MLQCYCTSCATATHFNESKSRLKGCECACNFLYSLKAAGKLSDLTTAFCLCPPPLLPALICFPGEVQFIQKERIIWGCQLRYQLFSLAALIYPKAQCHTYSCHLSAGHLNMFPSAFSLFLFLSCDPSTSPIFADSSASLFQSQQRFWILGGGDSSGCCSGLNDLNYKIPMQSIRTKDFLTRLHHLS